ncbi:undecaprenyl/decaprenyl-phosphate alpha-N-acetylglucosaminyl 1-phosphate transferase [Candidatus Peregrinibacteria bacterium]|nr:MAG: undecaprenyl/decaprenyl-phosphate alpha-N-acetylglucosaminyl 1-phosphate transferase [Candidatus Peregrinibacteria bacterium]
MNTTYLIAGLSSLMLTIAAMFFAKGVFPKLGLMDRPHKYGLNRKPIPYPVGILLYLVFLLLSLVFLEPTAKLIGLLLGAGLLVAISFVDDRIDLPPWLRLCVQALVAIILVLSGIGIETITNPFGGYLALNEINLTFNWGDAAYTLVLFSALFTVLWIVLLVNTMNWLDGIPGLVSGISVLGSLTLFFLSISDLVNQPEIAMMAILVAMIALGAWLFDFFPPKVIIGDSGSMFFGLMLASLAIFSGGKIATTFLILGFAILDALYVIIYRLFKRRAPWKGGEWDKYRKAVHLHHRLLQFGFSERQALLVVYFLSGLFGVIALFFGHARKIHGYCLCGHPFFDHRTYPSRKTLEKTRVKSPLFIVNRMVPHQQ